MIDNVHPTFVSVQQDTAGPSQRR